MTTNRCKLRLHFLMQVDEKSFHDGDSSKNGKSFALKLVKVH